MKKLIAVLSSLLLWASFAHGQGVPVQGSTVTGIQGHYGQLGAGLNGLELAPWDNQGFTSGTFFGFNNQGGSFGTSDFINFHTSATTGGFCWWSTTTILSSCVMTLSPGSDLSVGTVHSHLIGLADTATNATTASSLNGNAQGGSGAFGNFVAAANGLGATVWSPGSFSFGSWISLGQNGGSHQETDFINHYVSGNIGGFAWFAPTGSSLVGSQIMSLDTSGTLTVNQVNGNSSTATAFASNPTDCTVPNTFGGQIATNGNLTCFAPVSGKTTSVSSTGSGAGSTASTSVPLSSTMPDTNYTASCSLVSAFGAPYVQSITKGTTTITVTISNGQGSQAVTSGASEIDCTIAGT